MSVGSNLNEMENIEENVVTKGASPAEPMQKLTTGGTPATWEDLGGPTPENYKADDDSAKLKTPGATLKQVKDIVNKGAKPAEPMKAGVKEEEEKPVAKKRSVGRRAAPRKAPKRRTVSRKKSDD